MGGCRCSFRQCHVSTAKYPRMHFFRFPAKEPERLKKWMQYSQMEHMDQFSETRKKNTVACARHFRVECFMNYKMDKLAPNAVPTLIRLSKDRALDFELNIEKGVLVTLEMTKLEYLIPPVDFECPLYLENDKTLRCMLNELQDQPSDPCIGENVQYIVTECEDEQFLIEKPVKSSSNPIEILETIQFSAPFKRINEYSIDEIDSNTVDGNGIKKFKILNSQQCTPMRENRPETTILITSQPDQNNINHLNCDNIEFVESNNVGKQNADTVTNTNSEGADNDLEFLEIHKDYDESLHDLETFDSDSTTVQLKSYSQSFTDSIKQQLATAQHEILELKKQNEEMSSLQLKVYFLENENSQLKETCKENKLLRRQLLHLETKNIHMKKIVNEQKDLKEKILNYSGENKTLKEENKRITAELRSKNQEIEELKERIVYYKSTKSNDSELKLRNEHHECTAKENNLKEEITSLQKQVEVNENKLLFSNSKLLKIEADFNSIKNEKDSLQQAYSELEQKYWKLQALQSQESTVSTSHANSTTVKPNPEAPSFTTALTKAQLFNGIKRYLSSAMVSLVRMEMFGSSEREWKTDECQVAVDILRLGENVYKYFTDEWRFRLPALRDVRNWLSKSVQIYEEEDL